jgi:hypothetical protein
MQEQKIKTMTRESLCICWGWPGRMVKDNAIGYRQGNTNFHFATCICHFIESLGNICARLCESSASSGESGAIFHENDSCRTSVLAALLCLRIAAIASGARNRQNNRLRSGIFVCAPRIEYFQPGGSNGRGCWHKRSVIPASN